MKKNIFSQFKSHEMDMTEGSILKKLIIFSVPLILTNIIQTLFHSADVLILGMLTNDDTAVAAVGSNSALINLIIGLFIGLSVGANVLVGKYMGKGDEDRVKKVVGMSVVISITSGIFLLFIGVFFSRTFLIWMGCDPLVLDGAEKYLKVYFYGIPIVILYNFCSAILRASGDTFRPLIFLIIGGVLNIGGNIFFIKVLNLTVEGVAISTIISEGVSAFLSIIVLIKSKGICKLRFKYIRFYKRELLEMMHIGIPSGVQSCLFSISNVLIQSTVNTFGPDTMTANSIASQFDGIVYYFGYSVTLGVMSFVSQNYGACKFDRIKRIIIIGSLTSVCASIISGLVVILFSKNLFSIATESDLVIEIAQRRIVVICSTYFLCSIMDTMANSLRGMGKSIISMLISLTGSCLFRVAWIYILLFPYPSETIYLGFIPKLEMLYIAYPVSWILTNLMYFFILPKTLKRLEKKLSSPDRVVVPTTDKIKTR